MLQRIHAFAMPGDFGGIYLEVLELTGRVEVLEAFKEGLGLIQCTALVTNLILVENGAAPEGQAALESLRRGDQFLHHPGDTCLQSLHRLVGFRSAQSDGNAAVRFQPDQFKQRLQGLTFQSLWRFRCLATTKSETK